jgi:cytochrome oxidase Cu insertion factor (SCO1/SenC/PrrC family)
MTTWNEKRGRTACADEEDDMIRLQMTLTLLLVLLHALVVHAQLGPKDGGGLTPTDLKRVKVGDVAPDFTLESHEGKQISLSDYRGKKHVVLIFYRGRW